MSRALLDAARACGTGPCLGFDLHVHSRCSDGHDEPASLLARALGSLSILSITDHDTLRAYRALPPPTALELLVGIEVSCVQEGHSVHMLGYFPHGITRALQSRVQELEEARTMRIRDGIESLRREGLPLDWEEIRARTAEGVPCRSHVARKLVELGYGRTVQGCFRRYLSGTRFAAPAFSALMAIEWIRAARGIAVWAHPDPELVERFGVRFVGAGLQGLEIHTPHRKSRDRRRLTEFARASGLAATCGSDYHGNRARNQLGEWCGAPNALPEIFAEHRPWALYSRSDHPEDLASTNL